MAHVRRDYMPPSDRDYWLSIRQSLPRRRIEIPYRREFTQAEAERLRRGLWPQGTDDRWVIGFEGQALQMWRSWTGYCIFRLPARRTKDGIALGLLMVNNDPNLYRRLTNRHDVKTVNELIRMVLEAPA